jgi:regulator of cell morphogenesis and NO signaling
MTITEYDTLADLVVAHPTLSRVLERHGLDYCCGGQRTLADACTEQGIAVAAVLADLAEQPADGPAEWAGLGVAALADHIVATHHRYLQEELPLLDALAAKVAGVHGGRHPELADVHRLVLALRADLEPHMLKEERVLFPAIAALTAGQRDFPFGSIANPVRMMMLEHDAAGEILAELRSVSGGYAVPADGCASYRSLYERLEAVEDDTHLHVHKENNVLFPAVLRLADA